VGTPFLTIEKGFRVDTRNLLFRPKGFRKNRKYPLVTALHGMGMTAEEFARVFEPLRELPILFFVPEGVYPFEIRTGGQMRIGRAWYLYTGDEEEFVHSMSRSGRHLRTLVDKVIAEYPVDPTRRVLLGFSQGGYFAGYLGIRDYRRITGLVVMGARVKVEVLERELKLVRDLDVLLVHGRKDRAVPLSAATASLEALAAAGLSVDLKTYDCGHHITAEQVRDVRDWLEDLFF
jgi:phospholipase/carboxylesterase